LATALVAGVLAAAVGLYFVWVRGPAVLPFGLLGLVVVVTYTSWATRHALVCLVAPGLGFGPCMVLGTHAALTGEVSGAALVASLVPFFLVSDLLLLNQFPDVEADRTIGRRHLPIVLGRQRSATVYAAFLAGAYLSIVVGVVLRLLPLAALLGLLTAPLAVKAAAIARRSAEDLRALMPALGMNVVVNLVTPVLLAAGIWLG
jgi:1,4-dihydroxy-2-naphthoate octaprenyltransferase